MAESENTPDILCLAAAARPFVFAANIHPVELLSFDGIDIRELIRTLFRYKGFIYARDMMLRRLSKFMLKWIPVWLSLIFLLGAVSTQNNVSSGFQGGGIALAAESEVIENYLPITWKYFPWTSPFGVEIVAPITQESPLLNWATTLPVRWVRLNGRISWRQLQPNEGDPVQWGLLSGFETELRMFQSANIIPIVVVDDYPAWATAERWPGAPSYCGPLRSDKFQAFANFVNQLVNRYKVREFNVHVWELGNEPDIDGGIYSLPLDSVYGCWGDATDPYYGGKLYGEMLKIVTPVIKDADPQAQVWVGGLLLNSPSTNQPGEGRPELFLQGILEAGIGTDYSYFDVVPYHTYTNYRTKVNTLEFDYDNDDPRSVWYGDTWGGAILGKAKFLRAIMNSYRVQKPLFVNEISLTCVPEWNPSLCNPPVEAFLQMQASHLVRIQVRGLSEKILGFTWYTLDGPGWRNGGLLNSTGDPNPSYFAFQQLTHQLFMLDYLAPVDYGLDFEAYAFGRDAQVVHVVWSKEDQQGLSILVPVSKFVEARSRDGTRIARVLVGDNYQIPVGFAPVYVIRRP